MNETASPKSTSPSTTAPSSTSAILDALLSASLGPLTRLNDVMNLTLDQIIAWIGVPANQRQIHRLVTLLDAQAQLLICQQRLLAAARLGEIAANPNAPPETVRRACCDLLKIRLLDPAKEERRMQLEREATKKETASTQSSPQSSSPSPSSTSSSSSDDSSSSLCEEIEEADDAMVAAALTKLSLHLTQFAPMLHETEDDMAALLSNDGALGAAGSTGLARPLAGAGRDVGATLSKPVPRFSGAGASGVAQDQTVAAEPCVSATGMDKTNDHRNSARLSGDSAR